MKAINTLLDRGKFKEATLAVDRIISAGTMMPPEMIYEYARIYGLAGDKVKSVKLLNVAIDKGFWSINRVKEDNELKAIIGDAEVDHVLKRIRGFTALYTSGKAFLSNEEKKLVIDLVRQGLKTHYFDAKKANEMSEEVLRMFDEGFFKGKDTLNVFTDELVKYFRDKTNDKHFYIGVDYNELTERVPNLSVTTEEERNFGFREVAVRNGNIGYIRWDECIAGPEAYETAQNALNLLRYTRAIIIDISENGGGNGEISTFLYHYLFKSSDKRFETLLVKKCKDESEWHRSEPPVAPLSGGPDLGDKPIYILTSGNTFSAAEYFAFMMKELRRATIVGKNTGGGGNPVNFVSDGRFMMYVPTCQIMTKTGKSLEGKGVSPDIELITQEWSNELMQVVNADLEKKSDSYKDLRNHRSDSESP
ncbi:S41 family peptidase [Pedobacter psychroterrae]|nr:S41 family peptidase [Pedobacter psychroterrae]